MNLKEKLASIRKEIGYVQKTERGQNSSYVDSAVLLKMVRELMNSIGVLLIPKINDSTVNHIDTPTKNSKDAKSFVFSGSMSYVWLDTESEDEISVPWFLTGKNANDPAMAYGSALTYSERYFILKFFQISTAQDDPELWENRTKPPKKIKLGDDNLQWLADFCTRNEITGKEKKKFAAKYSIDAYSTTDEEFKDIKAKIEDAFQEGKK